MSYEEFVNEMEGTLQNLVGESLVITVHKALKNNGFVRSGIRMSEKNINISPTIYLEEFYEKYQCGIEVEQLAKEVLCLYQDIRIGHPWKEDWIYEFSQVKETVVCRLINYKKNEKMLKEVPYIKWQDLAIVFYLLLEMDEVHHHQAAMLVRREQLKWWNVSVEELYHYAVGNSEKLLPYDMTSLSALVEDLASSASDGDAWNIEAQGRMYVLTNRQRNYGASAMLYPGRLDTIGLYLKENFYILPSSVHEVIILPESYAVSRMELDMIIREINGSHLREEEYLSDHSYYYDRNKKQVS